VPRFAAIGGGDIVDDRKAQTRADRTVDEAREALVYATLA